MTLEVITNPHPTLRRVGDKLSSADLVKPAMKKFITDLTETMYEKDGVGIAAPQVDRSIQLCVIAKNFTPNKKSDLVLVNPVWTKASLKTAWDAEGCLSVPGLYGEVKRYVKIKVRALSAAGQPLEFEAKDFFARIIQHETDHLNGKLFIDKARNLQKVEKGEAI